MPVLSDRFHNAKRGGHRRRALRLLLLAAFVVSGFAVDVTLGAVLRPADAHAVLLESSPVDNAILDAPPPQARLRFNEAVTLTPQSIQLLDPKGDRVRIGAPEHAAGKANTAAAALPADLGKGTYTIAWRVLSEDSHAISGALRFSVGKPSVSVTSPGTRTSPVTPVVHAFGRGMAFLGLALALGGAVFLGVIWPAGLRDRRGRLVVWTGFVALGLGTVVVFLAQGPYSTGDPLTTAFDPGVLRLTLTTRIGQALPARLGIALALAVVFAIVIRRQGRGDGESDDAEAKTPTAVLVLSALCGLALVSTWPLTDHAHTGAQAWLAVPVTGLHLLAITLWFGGLVPLTACVVGPAAGRLDRKRVLEPALSRFSRLAQVCFTAIAVTGLYLAWRQVGTLGALGGTDYGRLLLVKFGVVLLVVVLAAQARRFVRRHGPRDTVPAGALRRLRRSVVAELILGAVVLSVTTVLVSTAPARNSYAPPVRAEVAIPVTARTHTGLDGGRVELKLTPAKRGANVADIYLVAKNESLVNVPEVSGRLESGKKNIGSLPVEVSAAEPGHYVASAITIPYPGRWVLWLNIRTSDFNEIPVNFPFTAR
jgi:copper transport protein